MYLLDIIPLTRIPHTQSQILSYFHGAKLPAGALVQIPLGRRQEKGVVIGSRNVADYKMEIKSANFELRNIAKIISNEPVLTKQQIELVLFLGQYYFCSPGLFAKMMLPKKTQSPPPPSPPPQGRGRLRGGGQKLIIAPTVFISEKIAINEKNAVLWHSELTQKQKNAAWLVVQTGQARTIIGTRSAVFLPFANLKEIIVVDEANPNHKSWDMFPHYDSRTIAQKLTEIFKAKLTLKSGASTITTPTLSPSFKEARAKLSFGEKKRGWPPIHIIDMRQELKDGNFSIFSIDLYEAIKKALAAKKQIILFINRRGTANFVLCRDCGYIAKCPNCDAPLAYHLINNKPSLLCHHCGAKDTPPTTCPKCHSWRIKTVGSGTQKVEAETKKFFPDAKILRLDSDSAAKPKDQQKIITDFTERQADILIATPMIFSWLTELAAAKPAIVGVLSADTLLHIPDFRSGERTWQMIKSLQSVMASAAPLRVKNNAPRPAVAGLPPLKLRGGEGELSQNNNKFFFIQTYNPDNSVLKYVKNNDYDGFIKDDLATRQALNYPPFSQIIKLTFRHRDAKKAGQEAKILAAKLENVIVSPAFARRSNPEYSKNDQSTSFPQTCPASRERRGEGGLRMGVEHQLSDTTSPLASSPTSRSGQPPPQLRRGGKNDIEISPALPAFLPRAKGKYVWNIIIKFLPFTAPSFAKEGRGGFYPPCKGGLGGYNSPDFLHHRNSLLQYVPQNWEIDVDPENLL
ncbi:primosomal protein N' [Patescibacteria group bacterium]|nr:primosomal protein N' [Patescibacteria group bacterium]